MTANTTTSVQVRRDAQGNVIPLDASALEQLQFGAPVAVQMSAHLEEGSEGEVPRAAKPANAPADGGPRNLVDYRQTVAEMSFEQRVAATEECVLRRGTFRDILYGLLGFCLEEKPYGEIEPFVEGFTEFHRNRQSARRYVQLLLRAGGLEEIELDAQGKVLTAEAKSAAVEAGLAPEDVDTLVFDWRVVTTDAGRQVHDRLSPQRRLASLLAADPSREEAYEQILRFCENNRSMGEIVDQFRGSKLMGFDEESGQVRQPSAYVDKLEKAAALEWNGSSWGLTECGKAYLAAC